MWSYLCFAKATQVTHKGSRYRQQGGCYHFPAKVMVDWAKVEAVGVERRRHSRGVQEAD